MKTEYVEDWVVMRETRGMYVSWLGQGVDGLTQDINNATRMTRGQAFAVIGDEYHPVHVSGLDLVETCLVVRNLPSNLMAFRDKSRLTIVTGGSE